MRHKITSRTVSLLAELVELGESIESHLAVASPAARDEWQNQRLRWPSEIEMRQGSVALSDEELEVMRAKVKRFNDILNSDFRMTSPEFGGSAAPAARVGA